MFKRLVFLLALMALFAVGYVVYKNQALANDPEEDLEIYQTAVTSAFIEETFAEPEEMDTAAAEEDFEDSAVSPEVQIAEYPGRRIVVSGIVSTSDDRRAIIKALKEDLSEDFKLDDQVKLDYQCGKFAWLSKVPDLDFSMTNDVRRLVLILTNTQVTLAGEVFKDAARVSERVKGVLPVGVALEDRIKVRESPEASLSVWAAPDRTVLVSGTVPEGDAKAYVDLVRNAMPGMPVVNDMSEDRFVESPDWNKQMLTFLPGFLRTTQRAGIKISKGRVVKIEGLVQAKAMADLRKRLSASFPAPRYQMEMDLQLGVFTDTKVTAPTVVGATAPTKETASARTVAEMIATSKIYFRSGRSRANQLISEELGKLDRMGMQWRKENFNKKVYVFGFTDSSGDPETNAYIKTRCVNVVNYLRETYGIDKSYFEVVGTPENHPPETGSASELRRVEFSLTDTPSQPPVANWSSNINPGNVLKPISYAELLAKSKVIYLGSGQITPSKEDRASLSQLGNAMVLEKITDVVVMYGYSDGKGKAAANKWYTEERCKAVAKEFIDAGVPVEQIVIRPVLTAQPAKVKDAPPENKDSKEEVKPEDNPRRVELVVMSREAFDAAEAEAKAAIERVEAAMKAAEEGAALSTNEVTTGADDPVIPSNGFVDGPAIVPAGGLEDKVIVPAGTPQ